MSKIVYVILLLLLVTPSLACTLKCNVTDDMPTCVIVCSNNYSKHVMVYKPFGADNGTFNMIVIDDVVRFNNGTVIRLLTNGMKCNYV